MSLPQASTVSTYSPESFSHCWESSPVVRSRRTSHYLVNLPAHFLLYVNRLSYKGISASITRVTLPRSKGIRSWSLRFVFLLLLGSYSLRTPHTGEWRLQRDSNPRPPPWQGGILTTELWSQIIWWRQLESNQSWAALAFRLAPRDLSP